MEDIDIRVSILWYI